MEKETPGSRPRRILVMRYSSLGDVALTNPVLDGLQAAFPRAQVFFATKERYAPAVANHPALSGTLRLKGSGPLEFFRHLQAIRELKPDLVLDLHDSLRTRLLAPFLGDAKLYVYDKQSLHRRMLVKGIGVKHRLHTIEKYLKVLEPLGVRPRPGIGFQVHVSRADQAFLRDFLERRKLHSSQLVVGIGPGSLWKTKRWFPERYAELATRLMEAYRCRLLWFGSRDEAPLIRSIQTRMRGTPLERGINLAAETDLPRSIALLGRCEIFVGNDSGLTHLAAGRGCRVVVIYGSTTPSLGFEPWGPHSIVEAANLPCRPCHVHGRKSCPLGHFKCMEDLTVDLVEGAVKRSVRRSL